MPSPLPRRPHLPGDLSPSSGDSRPCSSPCELLGRIPPLAQRLRRRLAWCSIDWEQVCLLRRLGAGGFGSVYEATYHGVRVAIKQVSRCSKNPRASRRSFWAELNAARLRHANIVRVLAASTHPPPGFDSLGTVIMEFGGNITLHQVIYGPPGCPGDSGMQLGLERCLKYSLDVVSGLLFLHAQSIVHLDLKPANILISEQDVCKIGDFGCSARLEDLRSPRTPHHLGAHTPAACSFPGENARSWEALGEARPGQSSLSAGALRFRAWAQSWSSAALAARSVLPSNRPALGLALGSPIFPSGCEGKLGVALESLQGRRDLT